MRPLRRISVKWSSELAYTIGLIATDGCLYKDGRHINLTSKDIGQIRTFKKCLGIKNKVGLKNSGFVKNKKYYYLQFSDVVFYKFLKDIGLTPAKSKTLKSLKIPKEYFFDFLRGCFDGDGSLYAYWDKRWHSSYMFYLSFVSASIPFLKWLENKIYRYAKAKGYISNDARSYQLKFAKEGSKILFEEMYHSNKIPFLKRKYLKFKKFLAIELKHNNARVQ